MQGTRVVPFVMLPMKVCEIRLIACARSFQFKSSMDAAVSLAVLRPLEVALHQRQVRSDRAALEKILHAQFREFGRSGRIYSREEVLDEFRVERPNYEIWSQDYEVDVIVDDVVLLTYRSAHIEEKTRNGILRTIAAAQH